MTVPELDDKQPAIIVDDNTRDLTQGWKYCVTCKDDEILNLIYTCEFGVLYVKPLKHEDYISLTDATDEWREGIIPSPSYRIMTEKTDFAITDVRKVREVSLTWPYKVYNFYIVEGIFTKAHKYYNLDVLAGRRAVEDDKWENVASKLFEETMGHYTAGIFTDRRVSVKDIHQWLQAQTVWKT
jgi:hypothetical protein